MTRKQLFKAIKEEQKVRAKKIRERKKSRKQDKRNGRSLWNIVSEIASLKYTYRHHHIAYCEMRGRERHEIECPRDDHPASQYEIDRLKEKWSNQIDEDVCVGTQGSN